MFLLKVKYVLWSGAVLQRCPGLHQDLHFGIYQYYLSVSILITIISNHRDRYFELTYIYNKQESISVQI